MDIPDSVKKLMRTDHEVRVFVVRLTKLEKENQELRDRLGIVEQTIRERFYKPNKNETKEPTNMGPPEGHKANHRTKPKHVDETINITLNQCPHCENDLGKVVEIRERIIEDIKPSRPHVKKYMIHRYYCRHCERIVNAKPAEIPKCCFGLNLLILIAFLRYGIIMPFNKIAKELDICYGVNVSEGTIQNQLTRFANYLGPEFESIKKEVREMAAVNVDETSHRINGKNHWLWAFITKWHSLLVVRDGRNKEVPKEILGEHYDGIVTTDCLATYDYLFKHQQKCWAHLLRDTKKMKREQGKLFHSELKHLLQLAKSGEFSVDDMIFMLDSTINKGFTDTWVNSLIKNRLVKFRDKWFTFIDHDYVDCTNNAAERALRPSVVMRKITGGNRSYRGARNHEVIMSVMQTWQKRGLNFMDESMKLIKAQLPHGE